MLTFLCHLKDVLNLRQNRSKNELVSANAMAQVHGSCLLWVIGSCLQLSQEQSSPELKQPLPSLLGLNLQSSSFLRLNKTHPMPVSEV